MSGRWVFVHVSLLVKECLDTLRVMEPVGLILMDETAFLFRELAANLRISLVG